MPVPDLIGDMAAPYALLQQTTRKIGSLMPNIVIEEIHHDTLVITKHPVMNGCPISDHAYKMPPTVQMKIGYSNSSVGQVGYVQQQYAAIIDLQKSLQPFDVTTGKRMYKDMMISNVLAVTDDRSENVLNAVITLEHVRRVGQSSTPLSSIPAATTPAAVAGAVAPLLASAVTVPAIVSGAP